MARFSDGSSAGYWYTVDVAQSNSLRFQVFDGSYDSSNGQTNGPGDNGLDGDNHTFHTTFTVYDTDATKSDISDNTTILCQADLTNQSAYKYTWKDICGASGISAVSGGRYLINVRTTDPNWQGDGSNNYALRVVAGSQAASCTQSNQPANSACYGAAGVVQPRLSAFNDMSMYNNINGSNAEFYLANVTPQYAGKTLAIDLWDPGDSNGDVTINIMGPGSSTSGSLWSSCQYSRNKIDGSLEATGPLSPCKLQTTFGGSTSAYNGRWLHFTIPLPADYGATGSSTACDPNVANPVTTGGSCWWQILYEAGGQTHDNTTWSAHIEGDPVRLTR